MPDVQDINPIDVGQKQTIPFDFGDFLPSGITLTGTPTVTVTTADGTDLAPSTIKVGSAVIGTTAAPLGSGKTNCSALQQFQGNVEALYLIFVSCLRTDGDIATMWTHLKVRTPR